MPSTKFEICSRALVLVGANPISSFADGSTESLSAAAVYDATVENWLSLYRWRFASDMFQLSRLAEAPTHRYDAAYQLPAETVTVHGVFVDDCPIDYSRYGTKALCNADVSDAVMADITFRADELQWPPYFQMIIQHDLSAQFAVSLAERSDLSDKYEKKADRQFAFGKTADAQQQTTRKVSSRRLIDVRR